MMKKIIQISKINCTLDSLFDFHLDSNNITKITPENIKVELLNSDIKTYEGKVVKLKTTKMFIPTYWEVKIEKLEKPNILVDLALKSPFKYWRHQHIFTKKGNMSELKDVIEFELPFGLLGKIISPFIENDIKKMFEYRHKKTKQILESK
jgi:ligand-binding SRPBCC domain-containing protein